MSVANILYSKASYWLGVGCLVLLLTGCRALLPDRASPLPPTDAPVLDRRDQTRPYEVVQVGREWDWPLLIDFERALDWRVDTTATTDTKFDRTSTQRLWGEYTGRLTVTTPDQGDVQLRLKEPVTIRDPVDTLLLWVKPADDRMANASAMPKWTSVWETAQGRTIRVEMGPLRGAGWTLYAQPLDPELTRPDAYPLRFKGLDWTFPPGSYRLYLDGLSVLQDLRKALRYPARPRRGLDLRAGQRQGVNTGTERLAFPVDAASVIPSGPEASQPMVIEAQGNGVYLLYAGDLNARNWAYQIETQTGIGSIQLVVDGEVTEWSTAGIQWDPAPADADTLLVVRQAADHLYLEYASGAVYHLRTAGYSLIVDVAYRGRERTGLGIAPWSTESSVASHQLKIPFWHEPGWAAAPVGYRAAPDAPLFVHMMLDPWYSNASAWERSAGGRWPKDTLLTRYHPAVGGDRNDVHERIILTASPNLEALLPRIPNPGAIHAGRLADRLLFVPSPEDGHTNTWVEQRYLLEAHGLTNLIWITPATFFQKGHESPSYRLEPQPWVGDELTYASFLAGQQAAGMATALYLQPRTISALNRFWADDAVRRAATGAWSATPEGWFMAKPLWSLYWHLNHITALKDRLESDWFWLNGFPAAPPWRYTDYDPRVPGRATFSQVLYADGDWLRVWAEDHAVATLGHAAGAAWYAGLLDGFIVDVFAPPREVSATRERGPYTVPQGFSNGSVAGPPHADAPAWRPYNPLFKLKRIQPLSVVYGAAQDAAADIDVHIADWLAYGQGGVIRYDPERMDEWVRAYQVMRTVQPHILQQSPLRIRYHCATAGYVRPSEAVASGIWEASRLYVEYPGGVELWVNGSWEDDWTVRVAGTDYALPPSGWVVIGPDFFVFSGWHEGGRIDYIERPDGVFFDPRGRSVTFRDHHADARIYRSK